MFKVFQIFILVSFIALLSACTTNTLPSAKTLPDLTFAHIDATLLNVQAIEIENAYSASDQDVSINFPTPPDIALIRYAGHRFEAAGNEGRFVFKVESSEVTHKVIEPEGAFMKWMKLDSKDHYTAEVVLRLYHETSLGAESPHSVLTLSRTISIPSDFSIARKELEQFKFIELLIHDVDQAVNGVLQNNFAHVIVPG